jgi:hypothetical protein
VILALWSSKTKPGGSTRRVDVRAGSVCEAVRSPEGGSSAMPLFLRPNPFLSPFGEHASLEEVP